jgi:hypothetical protein
MTILLKFQKCFLLQYNILNYYENVAILTKELQNQNTRKFNSRYFTALKI